MLTKTSDESEARKVLIGFSCTQFASPPNVADPFPNVPAPPQPLLAGEVTPDGQREAIPDVELEYVPINTTINGQPMAGFCFKYAYQWVNGTRTTLGRELVRCP